MKEKNLTILTEKEMIAIEGGSFIKKLLKKLGWGYLITEIVDNWRDIKDGLADGWKGRYNNN